jgi:hypothetical protein
LCANCHRELHYNEETLGKHWHEYK